ncbi:MAG: T9SS type A sorting domain-containing protein [Crocinitomicaceae bacterium]
MSFGSGQNLCHGSYFAWVTDAQGCQSETPCVSTQFLSTDESEMKNFKIILQSNVLQINQLYENLKIYNLSGQLVLESNTPEQNISIQELAAGPYVVSILKDDELYNKKFVKTGP